MYVKKILLFLIKPKNEFPDLKKFVLEPKFDWQRIEKVSSLTKLEKYIRKKSISFVKNNSVNCNVCSRAIKHQMRAKYSSKCLCRHECNIKYKLYVCSDNVQLFVCGYCRNKKVNINHGISPVIKKIIERMLNENMDINEIITFFFHKNICVK